MVSRAAKRKTLISETGTSPLRTGSASEKGFTLIEILLVIFIIGLASGVAIMSVPGSDTEAQQETIMLERVLDNIATRAVLSGDVHALDISAQQYSAMRSVEGEWLTVRGSVHDVPEDVRLIVRGEPNDDEVWRLIFDPAGVPLEAFIEVQGRRETYAIERIREDVGARR